MFSTDKGQKSVRKIVCKTRLSPSSGTFLKRNQPYELYKEGVNCAFIKAAL